MKAAIKVINGKEYRIAYRENTSDEKIIKEKQQYFSRDFHPEPGERWLDAGANIGLTKMLINSYGCSAISLEPFTENFEMLETNTVSNELYGQNLKVALGLNDGVIDFYIPRDGDYWRATAINHYKRKQLDRILCKVVSLEKFDVDCLKLDIEGSEIEILENVDLSRYRKICFEYHFDKDKRISRFMGIIERLRNFGFNVKHAKMKPGVELYNFMPPATTVRAWR